MTSTHHFFQKFHNFVKVEYTSPGYVTLACKISGPVCLRWFLEVVISDHFGSFPFIIVLCQYIYIYILFMGGADSDRPMVRVEGRPKGEGET